MQIIKQSNYVILNDDGTSLSDEQNKNYQELMKKFTDANVLGKHSPISPYSALRMAVVAVEHINNHHCSYKKGG
jgi:hypothetical protein